MGKYHHSRMQGWSFFFRVMKSLFPLFTAHPDLVFLDSAASAQKPQKVLDAVQEVHTKKYANIHRGLYSLSLEATALYDAARKTVAQFFGANPEAIVFTKNGTEAANLFVSSWGGHFLKAGDEVVLTLAEHHANFVPWLRLREKKKIILRFVEPDKNGVFSVEDFSKQLSRKTKLIAFPQVSNVAGQIFPVAEITALAQEKNIMTFLDICQSAPKMQVDLGQLGVDAAFFTGHKMGAPGGTGGLYCRKELLETMPPFLLGGDMVDTVSTEIFTLQPAPQKFEAGTPAIAEVIGLAAACDFLTEIGWQNIQKHTQELVTYTLKLFAEKLPNWSIIGPENPENRCGLIAFTHPQIHPHDIAQFLNTKQICVRSGLHCAEPLHQFLKLKNGSVRASFWLSNEKQDCERLIAALMQGEELFL